MATLNYVDIPSCATRLPSNSRAGAARPSPKVITSLPRPEQSSSAASSPVSAQPLSSTLSPSKLALNSIPQLLLSSTLSIPANAPTAPRSNSSISGTGGAKGVPRLLSGRDPLSIPITTVNFKRFVSKVGPVFWLQDRLEEIVMWRKGSKYTGVWMATYAFLCYFPRLFLLLPYVIVLSVIIATHPALNHPDGYDCEEAKAPAPTPAQTAEGSVDWLANVQAIQNLMGAFRQTFLPALHNLFRVLLRARLARLVDNDRLDDRHWRAELREVELFENERWSVGTGTGAEDDGEWAKGPLKPGERKAWTRGRDGWSGVDEDGASDVSSKLTFALEPGWAFVETEDWRPDVEGDWAVPASADDGTFLFQLELTVRTDARLQPSCY
ncbi:hypothetical protein IEO21_08519 [Rhodonia placenta]|uniref:TECPR1-like DysF domain-containing protein n=1 Tax=Rhodonia placenta TaxID=104341 RepID=A0A8H7TZB2_9APHY|nr:hypothetical protein IEO21_08519 [Postia placenta]